MKAPRWVVAPVSSGMVLVLLLGAIGAGLRIPGLSYLSGLPGLGLLDYRTLSAGGFLPLRAGYVDGLLGTDLGAGRAAPAGFGEGPTIPAGRPAIMPFAPSVDGPQSVQPRAMSPDHPFTNDNMDSPLVLAALPFTSRTDSSTASRQEGEPDSCSKSGGTAWYSYTARRDGPLVVETIGSDHATAVGVFTPAAGAGLREVACGTGATTSVALSFPARVGQVYLFQVAALVAGGRLVFHLRAVGRTGVVAPPATAGGEVVTRYPVVSGDGRYVAFEGSRTPYCRQECASQVYLTDRRTGRTTLASRSMTGARGSGFSFDPSLSHDGRYVGFSSYAADLVADDTNQYWDYFVHDRVTGRTVRASVDSRGRQGTRYGSPGGSRFMDGSLSPDGRFASFATTLGDLVPEDPPAADSLDVFVHDLQTGRTTRESVTQDGGPASGSGSVARTRISSGGRYVAFLSSARDLVPAQYGRCQEECHNVFVRDRLRNTTRLVSVSRGGTADMAARSLDMSAGGNVIAWSTTSTLGDPADTNGARDVFVSDLARDGVPVRVSISSTGQQQREEDSTTRTAAALFRDDFSVDVSGDGARVAFCSAAANLTPGDLNGSADVFLRDLTRGTTTVVSADSLGNAANSDSYTPSLSHDGRVVAFMSEATNLASEDVDYFADVFVHDLSGV